MSYPWCFMKGRKSDFFVQDVYIDYIFMCTNNVIIRVRS